jgi:hypothetical protein
MQWPRGHQPSAQTEAALAALVGPSVRRFPRVPSLRLEAAEQQAIAAGAEALQCSLEQALFLRDTALKIRHGIAGFSRLIRLF